MSERTALEIAARLEDSMPICGRAAVIALRRQHAEIERLTALNSALTAKGNAFVIENARQAEKIDSLTAERDAAIAKASALTQHLERVIGEHYAPSDCFSSGPMFGDARDAVCPACAALHFLSNPRASVDSGRDEVIAAVLAERKDIVEQLKKWAVELSVERSWSWKTPEGMLRRVAAMVSDRPKP